MTSDSMRFILQCKISDSVQTQQLHTFIPKIEKQLRTTMAEINKPPPSPPSEKSPIPTGTDSPGEPTSPPPKTTTTTTTIQPLSLDSPKRTQPIHPYLPEIRVPNSPYPPEESHKYDPITCQPIDITGTKEIQTQLDELRQEYTTPDAALKARELTAKEVKRRLEELGKKRELVQKELDKKVKEINMELKVLTKYQQVKASDIPA